VKPNRGLYLVLSVALLLVFLLILVIAGLGVGALIDKVQVSMAWRLFTALALGSGIALLVGAKLIDLPTVIQEGPNEP
jgi:flagellar biosynthesis component FlhA